MILFVIFLGKKIQFDVLNFLNNIIVIFPLIGILMTIYTGKKFESLNLVNKILFRTEEYFKSKVYKEYNINLEELEELKMDLINMNTEVND